MRLIRTTLLAATLIAWLPSPAANAGQVRITLAGMSFTPSNVTIHQGDHVVWVWQSGTHSVTSGTDGSPAGNGVFNASFTGSGSAGLNTAFSWQGDRTGNVPFYCVPHFSFGMTGVITLLPSTSTAAVSDFRITEVLYAAPAGSDLIEIANLGTADGDLGRYRIAVPGDVEGIPLLTLPVAKNGGRVVIHVGASGTNTATDVFLPALSPLPDAAGSVALYVPNTITGHTAVTDATQIIDFVQYGAGGEANEATAGTANVWTPSDFVPVVGSAGHSIEFCGGSGQYGASHWAEISSPTFGSDGHCATPANPGTWGRVKVRYR